MTVAPDAARHEAGQKAPTGQAVALRHNGLPLDGLFERVRGVVPLVASRARQAESEGKPDDDVIESLKATDVFRSFVAKRFGGYEIDLQLYVDIGIAVSEACASNGWITTFYMEHNWLLGFFPEAWQEQVFSTQPYVLAPGSVNPNAGRARRTDGGYRLDGHWKFATGVVHADWVLLSAQVETGGEPQQRICMVPVHEVDVVDAWFVDGMAATGSRDIVAKSVLVAPARPGRAGACHRSNRKGLPAGGAAGDGGQRRKRPLPRPRAAADCQGRADDECSHRVRCGPGGGVVRAGAPGIRRAAAAPRRTARAS